MFKRGTLLCIACFFLFYLGGCASTSEHAQDKETAITVAAASDLTYAFTEIAQVFEKKTNISIQLSFGSTGTLTQQIENGAPFDVFAAANEEFIEKLREKGKIISETKSLYAHGSIGITSLKDRQQVNTFVDLLQPEVKKIAIANPDHAPYGIAAKEALQAAAIWEDIEDKLIYGKNISDALTLVTTGNAEAGIISHSIVTDDINFNVIDSALYNPINQTIAVIKGTPVEEQAKEFIAFVISPEGQNILKKYGFVSPEDHDV